MRTNTELFQAELLRHNGLRRVAPSFAARKCHCAVHWMKAYSRRVRKEIEWRDHHRAVAHDCVVGREQYGNEIHRYRLAAGVRRVHTVRLCRADSSGDSQMDTLA